MREISVRRALCYSTGLTTLFTTMLCFAFITTGPLFPTVTTGSTNTIGGGTVLWVNDANIKASDGVFATCVPGAAVTDDLRGGTFGFTIAGTDTINGIMLEVSAKDATNGVASFNTVVLEGGGSASANRATATTLTTTNTVFTFGSAADLWGTTWTPAQINAAGFVGNASFNGGAGGVLSVDFFRITVTSTAAGGTGMGRRVIRSQTRTLDNPARQGL